jgi:hypothetical protein
MPSLLSIVIILDVDESNQQLKDAWEQEPTSAGDAPAALAMDSMNLAHKV